MVIIITGPSHTGKTALARKLLEKYKYPYFGKCIGEKRKVFETRKGI